MKSSGMILSRDTIKLVFGVTDQVRHESGCTVSAEGYKLEGSDLARREISTVHVAKTKALISVAVTAQQICVFVFA